MLPHSHDHIRPASRRAGSARIRRGQRCAVMAAWLVACLAASVAAADGVVRLRGAAYLGDLPTHVVETLHAEGGSELALEVSYGASGRDNLKALRAGEIDFTVMAPASFVIDAANDPTPGGADDPVILANLAHAAPINHVVALDTAPTAEALRGGRVGLDRGTNAEFLWALCAEIAGLRPEAVTLVDLAPEGLGDALARGDIDAAVVWQPWTQRLQARFGERLRINDASDFYTSRWLLVARATAAAGEAAQATAILALYRAAADRIAADPDGVLASWQAAHGVTGLAGSGLAEELIFDVTLDWSLFAAIQRSLLWARNAGHAERAQHLAFGPLYAPGPLRAIAPDAVTLPPRAGGEVAP